MLWGMGIWPGRLRSSLSFLANKTALHQAPACCRDGFHILDRGGCPLFVPRVDQMTILGVSVDATASSACAVEHRIAAAQAHFFARKSQLACPRVPLRERLRRLYATVGATLLWGAGGWNLSAALVRRLETFELFLLRRVISCPRRPQEPWVTYLKRSASAARSFLTRFSIDSLIVRVFKTHHGWAGHAARAPPESPLARALRFRDLDWWSRARDLGRWDRKNTSGWRHPRSGPNTRWESCLYSWSPAWATGALDREAWRSSLPAYLVHCAIRFTCKNSLQPPRSRRPHHPRQDLSHEAPDPGSEAPIPRPPERPLRHPDSAAGLWRLAQSHSARHFSAVCVGAYPTVPDLLLGRRSCADSVARYFCASLGRQARKITTFLRVPWRKLFACAPPDAMSPVSDLADDAIRLRKSSDSWSPPSDGILEPLRSSRPSHPVFLKASYCGRVLDLAGGAGVQICAFQNGIWVELFACSLYLGRCSEPLEAEFQACGCALLSLHSLLASFPHTHDP